MVKSLQREPEEFGEPVERTTHCVLVEFSIAGTAEEGQRIQDVMGTQATDLLRDVIVVMLGRDRVPSTHVKVRGWRKRGFFGKLFS